MPDLTHNRQGWTKSLINQDEYHARYSPIYIDLYDNFNQQKYYALENPNYLDYPNDDIHMMVAALQNFVFNSTSIADIKQRLLEYVHSNPYGAQAAFNLTEENINKLFEYYE